MIKKNFPYVFPYTTYSFLYQFLYVNFREFLFWEENFRKFLTNLSKTSNYYLTIWKSPYVYGKRSFLDMEDFEYGRIFNYMKGFLTIWKVFFDDFPSFLRAKRSFLKEKRSFWKKSVLFERKSFFFGWKKRSFLDMEAFQYSYFLEYI